MYYYGRGRSYIYKLIVKQYIDLVGFNFDELSDDTSSELMNILYRIQDNLLLGNEIIN